MSKLKLPEQLKSWKVVSTLSGTSGFPTFSVAKTEFDGTKDTAVLTFVSFEGENYSSANVDLINEEAAFVKSVLKLRGVSNYIDAVVDNAPAKSKISLYLLTTNAKSCVDLFGKKQLSDGEIVDFGLQISEILDKLEQNNILHGNLKPENVFVNPDGSYVLGGFTAFEGTADEPSFLAPEMQSGRQPDYTTDIYSLGLMMYAMSNGGKLPFENENTDRDTATKKRLSLAPVPAPSNGNEKLKSVIVIACQPENKNRWKNAGNIKNALAAIKAELPAQKPETPPAVIVPEPTAFESNVFEEYAFDEAQPAAPAPKQESEPQPELNMAKGAAIAASAAMKKRAEASAAATKQKKKKPANNILKTVNAEEQAPRSKSKPPVLNAAPSNTAPSDTAASDSAEDINNRVFDDYELSQTRVFNLRGNVAENKDYGDYFEDETPKETSKTSAPVEDVPPVAPSKHPASEQKVFEEGKHSPVPYPDAEPTKRNKSFIIGIVIIILALLAALAALGIYAAQNGLLPFGKQNSDTTAATEPSTQASNVPAAVATTVPVTESEETVEPTTEETVPETYLDEDVYPENVVSFYFDYATIVLKEQGLQVAYEYSTSTEWEEGFVISMSPDGSEPVKRGSTITLVISSGKVGGSSSNSGYSAEYDESSQTE